jgi:hypothetical protein
MATPMSSRSLAFCLAAIALILPTACRANCVEDPRKVTLAAGHVVQLKSYTCSAGDSQAQQIKVEFHRFSDLPASLLIGKTPSNLLTKIIGSPRIIENEVFKAYAELLRQFGWTQDAPRKDDVLMSRTQISVNPEGGSDEPDDLIRARKVRTIQGVYGPNDPSNYPAATEITELRKKTVPAGVNYFYSVSCTGEDEPPAGEQLCKKPDNARITMSFWRPLRPADVADYAKNLRAYNALLKEVKKTPWPASIPRNLKLAQYLAGAEWPEDFLFLVGSVKTEACGDDEPGIAGWEFDAWPRAIFMDAVTVENVSKQPVRIGAFYGLKTSEPRLRVFKASDDQAAGAALGELSQTLAPGARVLYPTQINLFSNAGLEKIFEHPQVADEVHKKRGLGEIAGTAAHRAPPFKDYVFGPDFDVTGLLVDGRRVELGKTSANFIDITVSAQIGSCPYLVSWDAHDREWVDHGKILHSAHGKGRENTETRVLPGFTSRFRLEEREAELALIDQVELVVALTTGETLTLKSENAKLAARDGDYLQLYWGDAVEIEFALPKHLSEQDIVESRISVTGHYRRYASLMADTSVAATCQRAATAIGAMTLMRNVAMCPVSARGPAPLTQALGNGHALSVPRTKSFNAVTPARCRRPW